MTDLTAARDKYAALIENASDLRALDDIRVAALGKKGEISAMMQGLGKMSLEEKKVMGPALNGLKTEIAALIEARKTALEDAALDAALESETMDMSLPVGTPSGTLHPVQQVMEEMAVIFSDMGFSVAEGPDIEDDFHNFTALNFPKGHPARDMHDTFFMAPARGEEGAERPTGTQESEGEKKVLRTHTSPVQIRTMINEKPPIRIIAPGRTFRCDSDQTHTPMFHQVEGMAIDKDITMANLKWTLEEFVKAFFEVDNVELRFRASHFPFTEPSAEVDIRCSWDKGVLKVGEGDDWLEILGSGMVHPKVLSNCNIDPAEWQGFAFGVGIDRIAMLKYGIPDLRGFFESDLRWLRHYGFRSLDIPTLHSGLSA